MLHHLHPVEFNAVTSLEIILSLVGNLLGTQGILVELLFWDTK